MESEISNKQEENPTNKDQKGNRNIKPASEHTTEASSASAEHLMHRATRPECHSGLLAVRKPAPELRDQACGHMTGILSIWSFIGRTVATGARSGRQALIVSRAGGHERLPEGLGTSWSAL